MDTALDLLPLPAAHARALQLLSDANVEIGELALVIEGDPALTASILRGANSAASAPIQEITTAQQAVIRMGLTHTRRMIVSAVTSSAFAHLHRAELDAEETWRHLVATALLTQAALWRRGVPRGAVSEAFTVGMLHDVGRLSMATQDPSRYAIVATLARCGADVREAEMRMYGFDHATWAGRVCAVWRIPERITDAIVHHHDAGGSTLAEAVRMAREIAWSLGIGDGLLAAPAPTYPEQPEHEAVVGELGGVTGLTEQIDWYRGAMGSPSAIGSPAAGRAR